MAEFIDLNNVITCSDDSNKSNADDVRILYENCDASSGNYIDIIEHKLQNAIVDNESDAYSMYCDYGHAKGFSVRKEKQDYFAGTTQMRSKLFMCSKEGTKDLEIRKNGKGVWTKSDGRTGCQARIWFTHVKDGPFKVTKWIKDHNHELTDPKYSHLLWSARSIGPSKGNSIESHLNYGVRLIDSYNMVSEDCGSEQNLGYTRKDMYNYVSRLKSSKIEACDCQSVINHFKKKTTEEGLFYWDVQLDTDGRVANLFWRDSRARIDYELFWDIVTFDTTYRTNKYGLICAPFVGVNHHKQNVMFACGFLSDETIPSFKWLFDIFLESMGGKQPQIVFIDQDAAMMNIVPKVFHESKHRLCLWHISV